MTTPPEDTPVSRLPPEPPANGGTARSRAVRPLSLLGVVFACVLLSVIAAAAFGGYQAGVSQREAQLRATQTVELKLQFDLGTADLAAGRHEVAAERFAYILSLNPDYPGAAESLARARAALKITPTAAATPIPSPVSQDAAGYFALAQEYLAVGDWDGVITQLAILRGLDPAYESVRVDGMLFVALRNRGVARIQGDAMEAGIFDLDQAGAFAPLDTEAVNYRAWARLYLNAQSYWGVNWGQTVEILELLYTLAPNFKDTSSKYFQAARSYAAELAALGDACGASSEYQRALSLFVDESLVQAQATAQAGCVPTPGPDAQATPDPLAPRLMRLPRPRRDQALPQLDHKHSLVASRKACYDFACSESCSTTGWRPARTSRPFICVDSQEFTARNARKI